MIILSSTWYFASSFTYILALDFTTKVSWASIILIYQRRKNNDMFETMQLISDTDEDRIQFSSKR